MSRSLPLSHSRSGTQAATSVADVLTVYSRRHVSQFDLSFVLEQISKVMQADTKHCKINYLSYLICRARELMYPHTKGRSFCPEWDRLFAYVLVHSVSQCVLPQAWDRKIKEIFTHDLDVTPPHDGSVGHVVHLFQTMKSVLDAVVSNDKKSTMSLLQRSKLRLPVLNIIDEFGWNLLHHASFHSAADVIKALVFEGISPNQVCRCGQTPIHVAASSLRYGSITTFLGLGSLSSPGALSVKDNHGRTPLGCLLHTLSVGAWNRKLSSQQLLDFINILLARGIDLWNLECTGEISPQCPLSKFGLIVVHSDAFVAEKIIRRAFEALHGGDTNDVNNSNSVQKFKREDIIFEIKRIILLIIIKRKSRVLATLLTTFGEIVFEDVNTSVVNIAGVKELDDSMCSDFFHLTSPCAGLVNFLHQCLCKAAETNSLRIMSMLLKFGALLCPCFQEGNHGIQFHKSTKELYYEVVATYFLRDDDAVSALNMTSTARNNVISSNTTLLESYLCKSSFLLLPVLRGDSNMLRLITDYMDEDPVTLLWLFSPPCLLNTKDIASTSLFSRSMITFRAWCHRGKLRESIQLLSLAHSIYSPMAVACLKNQPYLLKLILNKHWCCHHTSTTETSSQNNYLYKGINPLICCLFSGSVSCMTLLLEHFGTKHFENLCNCKDDLKLLPLPTLMLLLRTKLKRRIFASTDILDEQSEAELFVEQMLRYFSFVSPSQDNILEMLRILLPRINCDKVQDWQDTENIIENERLIQHKIEALNDMKESLEKYIDNNSMQDHSLVEGNGPESCDESTESFVRRTMRQWDYLEGCLNSDTFVRSLRTLSAVVCNDTVRNDVMNLKADIDEIRMNRQFQNITRAVVLLLKSDEVDFSNLRTDWWEVLSQLINSDYKKSQCKLARLMMSMKNRRINDIVLSRARECVSHTQRWLNQGNKLLPPRKSNCYFVHNCFEVLDLMYKWSLLVVSENIQARKVGSDLTEREIILAKEDISAIDSVVQSLTNYCPKSASSPFMALLGEEFNPIGFDIAVCTAGELLSESPYVVDPKENTEVSLTTLPTNRSDVSNINVDEDGGASSIDIDETIIYPKKSRRKIFRCLDNISSICDDVLSILIDDPRIIKLHTGNSVSFTLHFYSVPDMCGLTPLIGMCCNGLWKSATKALLAYSISHTTKIDQKIYSDNKKLKATQFDSPVLYFPGGLKDFLAINDIRLSTRIGRHIRDLLRDWDMSDLPLNSSLARNYTLNLSQKDIIGKDIRVVNALDIAVLKRENTFVMFLLSQHMFSSRCTQELMMLAYITNNVDLCLRITLECDLNTGCSTPQVSLKFPSYVMNNNIGISDNGSHCGVFDCDSGDYRFCNDINDFSVGYNVRHNTTELEEIHVRKNDGYLSLRKWIPIAKCAAYALVLLSQKTRVECKMLNKSHNEYIQGLMNNSSSVLQNHQRQAIVNYGFLPMYKGPFAGLCFSNDGRIWIMDGSLMSPSAFFADVMNLSIALPVPQTNQQTGSTMVSNTSGFTIVSTILMSAGKLSEDILDFIFHQLTRHSATASRKQFLSIDAKQRTPVFFAISSGKIALANRMLKSISSDETGKSLNPSSRSFSIQEDGLSYYFLKTSSEIVSKLESDLENRIQGNYCHNNVSGILMRQLMIHLDRVAMLWDYLREKCEISSLARLVYDPSGQILDCFQRAKSILLLLNIPFSQLNNKLSDHKGTSSGQQSSSEVPLLSGKYQDLSPEQVKQLVPWKTAMDLKHIVQGWVKIRARGDVGHGVADGASLQSMYASKMKDVMNRQPNCYPAVPKEHIVEYPYKQALANIESSVLLYHSLDLSLVTYGFSSCRDVFVEAAADGNALYRKRDFQSRDTLWNSQFPPLILAETRHLRQKKTNDVNGVKHMTQLLTMYKKNSSDIQKAVQCAYTILEFARTLSTTRILIALTQEVPLVNPVEPKRLPSKQRTPSLSSGDFLSPSSSVPCLRKKIVEDSVDCRSSNVTENEEATRHPVDEIRHSIIFARDNFSRTKSFISSLANVSEDHQETPLSEARLIHTANLNIQRKYLSNGAATRLHICDKVSGPDFNSFLSLKSVVSATFTQLRHILLEALSIILRKNPHDSENNDVANRLDRYLAENGVLDEKRLLEGKGDGEQLPLSNKECDALSLDLLKFIQRVSINDLTGVNIESISRLNEECSPSQRKPCATPHLAPEVMDMLFRHIQTHPTIYCRNSAIPIKTGRGWRSDVLLDEGFIALRHCPTVSEQAEILDLLGFSGGKLNGIQQGKNDENDVNASNVHSSNDQRDVSARTRAALKDYVKSLRVGYRVSETIIEFILTVIGLHSMSHVYLLDSNNSRGGLKCSPYVSLCYARERQSYDSHINKEDTSIDCFYYLRKCDVVIQLANPFSKGDFFTGSVLESSHIFSEYSELQYCIFCAALCGKPRLFEQFLEIESQSCSSEFLSYRQQSCLIWYVLLICPHPSNNYEDDDAEGSYQCYSSILAKLLRSGFGAHGPVQSQLSTLDLAALKQLAEVVHLLLGVYLETPTLCDACSLLQLGAFHFIALSKKIDSSTLQAFLAVRDFDHNDAVAAGVSMENFIPACINDSEIFCTMFEAIHKHLKSYKSLTSDHGTSLNEIVGSEEPMLDLLDALHSRNADRITDFAVHLLVNSFRSILKSSNEYGDGPAQASKPKHCPLFRLVTELASEVLNLHNINCKTEVNTVVRSLSWPNVIFVLAGKTPDKFRTFFVHFFCDETTDQNTSLTSSGLSSLQPLIGLTESRFGQVSCDLLHYVCFYSMDESLQLMIDSVGNSQKELNLNDNLFFAPLNNSITPIDVALAVGSSSCLSILLNQVKRKLSFHEVNNALWKMLYSALGQGLGGEGMTLLLLRFIVSTYNHYSKQSELRNMIRKPIRNSLPRSGVVLEETLLHLSARRGYTRLCRLLIESGADAGATCATSGLSVIATSIACGHAEVTQVLGQFCPREKNSVLIIAAMFRSRVLKYQRHPYKYKGH